MDIHFPPFEERETVRNSKVFKDFIYRWNHGKYNSVGKVGPLMKIAKEYVGSTNNPTREGYHEFYFNHPEGRSKAQAVELIKELAKAAEITIPEAVCYWCIHILDGSFAGINNEITAKKSVESKLKADNKPYTVRFATDAEDRTYGVDLIVEDNGKPIVAFQVKKESYFVSSRETVVAAREGYNPPKYAKYKQMTGADVWYINIDRILRGVPIEQCWKKALR